MLRPLSPADAPSVAAIQTSELAESMVVRLGRPFLEDFYFGRLLAHDLMAGYVYEVEGAIAGFIAFTSDSARLFREGLRKHFGLLCGLLARQVLRRPAQLKAIWRSGQFLLNPRGEGGLRIDAEILSFAVLPAYRTLEFYRATGVKVANVLFEAALARLRELGVREFKLSCNPTNVLAHVFYRQYGLEVIGPLFRFGQPAVLMRGDMSRVGPVSRPLPSREFA